MYEFLKLWIMRSPDSYIVLSVALGVLAIACLNRYVRGQEPHI